MDLRAEWRRGRLPFVLGLTLTAVLLCLAIVLLRKDHVDHCLDSGGCWDYDNARCEYEGPSRCQRPAPR